MSTFNRLSFTNDSDYLERRANSFQKKMFNSLVELERMCNSSKSSSASAKTSSIINIAVNNSDDGLEAMRSVVDYFYPNKLREGVLKNLIQRISIAVHNEIRKREASFQEEKKKKDLEDSMKVEVPKAQESKHIEEFNDEFPTFAPPSFPDTNIDIFSKMLKDS